LIGQFDAEIIDTTITLAPINKGFAIGDTPTAGANDVTVSIVELDGRTISNLFIVPEGGTVETSADLGILKITPNKATPAIEFTGTADTLASQKYIIRAELSDSTVLSADLAVIVVSPDLAINSTWTITEPGTTTTTSLQKNVQSQINMTSPLDLTLAPTGAITVNLPGGGTKTLNLTSSSGADGYYATPDPINGGTLITILYTPDSDGEIGLDITYSLDGGATTKTQSITGIGRRTYYSGGSSSSCGMGFGVAGILALAGVALIRRRESH